MTGFNPYHKWLGIPLEEQPANHYRLLGLPIFESDPEVIDGAAERQTIYLRTFQSGPNAELAERLLNEVSQARVCLLNNRDKSTYDETLQASQLPSEPPPPEPPPPELEPRLVDTEPEAIDSILANAPGPEINTATPSIQTRRPATRKTAKKQLPVLPIAIVTIVIVVILLVLLSGPGSNEPNPVANTPPAVSKAPPISRRPKPARPTSPPTQPTLPDDTPDPPAKPAVVSVETLVATPFTIKADPSLIPPLLQGGQTWRHQKGTPTNIANGVLRFTVQESGEVFLVADWKSQGNRGGGWFEQRLTRGRLVEQGWQDLGSSPWDPEVYLLKRMVTKGDSYEIRTNKYWPPALVVRSDTETKPSSHLLEDTLLTLQDGEAASAAIAASAITLQGHELNVNGSRFSPDGTLILSSSSDKTLKLWDVKTGDLQQTFTGHNGYAERGRFSPDGKRVVSSSTDQTCKVWNAETGEALLTLTGHSGEVHSACFSPDGTQIVSGGGNFGRPGEIKVWNAQSGEAVLDIDGHSNRVWSVAFHPDGQSIASGSEDTTVKIWNAETSQLIRTLEGHTGTVNCVVFSSNGKWLASASADSTIKLWDTESGQVIRTFEGHTAIVDGVAFSPSNRLLASGGDDQTVKIWDRESGREILWLEGHDGVVIDVHFSPDGQRLVSGSSDKTVRLWDLAAAKPLSDPTSESLPPNFQEGLVAYYPLNGNAQDASVNKNHGQPRGAPTPTADRHGTARGAYRFDGKGDQVEIPHQPYLNLPGDFTISLWADLTESRDFLVLLGKSRSGPIQPKWIFGSTDRQSPMNLAFHLQPGARWFARHPWRPVAGQWNQYLITKNASRYTLYLDGTQVATTDGPWSDQRNNTSPLTIGVAEGAGWLPGSIDDVRIYNRALSETEVKQLYSLEKPSSADSDIPAESSRLAYRQQLYERFKDDMERIKQLKTLEEFQQPLSQLAADVYTLLNDPTLTPAARYETYDRVTTWARKAGNSDLFFQAVDQWAKEFQVVDVTLLRTKAIEEWAQLPMDRDIRARFLVTVVAEAKQADQANRWSESARLYRIGVDLVDRLLRDARRDKKLDRVKSLVVDKNRLQARLSSLEPLLSALNTLAQNPENQETQLAAAFHVAGKDWDTALPYFTRGANPQLRTAAQLELDGSTTTAQQIAIADQWYGVALQHNDPTLEPQRHALLRHARDWYRRCLDQAAGDDKLRIAKQLESIPRLLVRRQPATLTRSLLAYYAFEGSGHDATVNANHLPKTAPPAVDRFGIEGGAVQVDSANVMSTSVKGLPLGNTYRTLSLWTNQKTDSSARGLAAWGTAATGEAFSVMTHPNLGGTFVLTAWGSTNDINSQMVADGQWHHVVAVYDGSLRIYIDGRLRASSPRQINTSTSSLFIGSQAGGIQAAEGAIDDVRIYNRALSATEIKTLYEFEKP